MKSKNNTNAKSKFYVSLCDGRILRFTSEEIESVDFQLVAEFNLDPAKKQSINVRLFKLTEDFVYWSVDVDDGDGAMEIMVSADIKKYIEVGSEQDRTWPHTQITK